ncbi:calcium-binding tyrosine phosphorylation-regulated protein isoform X2 [Mixophyes fleayi]|uniref:calcium-binding tyrosine phosphorylation-regulated protein isoform X2 n=1 Tax=Mixophyes fleayi TaxID=3061075 RepID=UPI003F4E02A0
MMPTKPRLLVPYGLKTLLEGLSRAVMVTQPGNIAHFASFYFTELMQYRKVNPTLDIKDLVKEFQSQQGEKEPENLWTLHPLSDLNQHKISLEKAQQRRNVFINNNGEPYKSGHLDQSMNSQYAQVTEQVSRRSKYVEPHLYPCMERSPPSSVQPVFNTSPAYMVAEEAKEVVNTPPYIMVGTSVQEPQESNKQNLLRFTTKPSSLPVTTDSSTQTEDQMQDACALKAPSYVSMSVDMDELYRLCASHSIAQFAEASPVPSYALHRSIAAKAAAATRCPSINEVMNPPKFSNPRTDQQIGTDGGYGRPYEALKPDKIPAVLKVPEETRKS